MRASQCVILALGLAGAALALPALAADKTYYIESKADFANCGDPSFSKAVKDGVSIGLTPSIPPEMFMDEKTKQPSGIDWEMNKAVLDWMGVKNIKVEWMPWESQIPALLSKRTDVIAGNIHHTTERDKVISFSGPAYWYGPVVIVTKGNPLGIKSYTDLNGKDLGLITGSAAEDYAHTHLKANEKLFKAEVEELQSLNQGRLQAVLEDDLVYYNFVKNLPNNNLEPLWSIATPTDIIEGGGYGMARYAMRKEDCSLRAAYTLGLSEIRANGQASDILKKYGLTDRNLVWFKLNP